MAQLPGGFHADQHGDMRSFEPAPAGTYLCKITDSSYEQNSLQTGWMVKYTAEILQGEYAGKKIFQQLNIVHQSAKAQQIANEEFATLCRALGRPNPQDTVELHNIPFYMTVRVVPATEQYRAKNEPTGYAPYSGGTTAAPAATTAGAGSPAPQQPVQQAQQPAQQQPAQQGAVQEPAAQEPPPWA